MKSTPLIFLILVFTTLFQSLLAQKKTCSSEENQIEDLNIITKCSIEQTDNKKTPILKVSYRKIRKKKTNFEVKKRGKVNSIKANSNIDNSFINNDVNNASLNLTTSQEILFSVVENIPMFPNCSKTSKEDNLKCFNTKMVKHFSNNFYPERIDDDTVNKKAFIQFTINRKGEVKNIEIKAKEKSSLLEKEIKRVLNKLPKFSPGTHHSIPVDVKYSIPITLTHS